MINENIKSYPKEITEMSFKGWLNKEINESSRYSKELFDLEQNDQRLRNVFADNIKTSGGWSQELVDDFVKKHKTNKDDVFNDKETISKFITLFPNLDFQNFDKNDWSRFSLLIMHLRQKEYLNLRKKALQEMIKHNVYYKNLATDIAREIGILPELKNITLNYPNDTMDNGKVDNLLKEKKISWKDLIEKIMGSMV
jgi:hypothetical protein